MARRVAAIDCGTNSIRLLVADVEDDGVLVDVHREMRVVRLGEGVDATGRISSGALDRTWAALSDYTAILRASGAVRVRMAATSASRDADNRQDFVDMVRGVLGQEPEVITGVEEASLTFLGAVGGLAPDPGPFLVADIGGGSTELVVGSTTSTGDPEVHGRISLDIGCVRLTERILRSDPPPQQEISAATEWATELLSGGLDQLPLDGLRRLVPVSGTATTVAAAALHLPTYDPARIHLSRIPAGDVHRVATTLLHSTRAHRAALGYMHPGRVDVIGAGSLVLSVLVSEVERRTGIDEATVSEHDILDGIALSLG
ncbi:exopolyphosphatase [Nakamurella sp. YIM 132087]|uniref:Exopolyphosphatase n=1 Tax=Nakamurella alba TaxID=2665158 RepID=A0A7K1FFD5_9ACTN|nr:Ppx/GppA phosphatase family protein [Nakamurella alba]MTD12786.1 exopolyphosphatase [Nakamurella alba]